MAGRVSAGEKYYLEFDIRGCRIRQYLSHGRYKFSLPCEWLTVLA